MKLLDTLAPIAMFAAAVVIAATATVGMVVNLVGG
jgi:hypothetical protein